MLEEYHIRNIYQLVFSAFCFQDLLIHVRDISHPETVHQKLNVLNVLKNLKIPEELMNSMIEVHNKIDLVDK